MEGPESCSADWPSRPVCGGATARETTSACPPVTWAHTGSCAVSVSLLALLISIGSRTRIHIRR